MALKPVSHGVPPDCANGTAGKMTIGKTTIRGKTVKVGRIYFDHEKDECRTTMWTGGSESMGTSGSSLMTAALAQKVAAPTAMSNEILRPGHSHLE